MNEEEVKVATAVYEKNTDRANTKRFADKSRYFMVQTRKEQEATIKKVLKEVSSDRIATKQT